MKSSIFILLFILLNISVYSQTIIRGKVSDSRNSPIIGANVYFKGTYEGTTVDSEGNFKFKTDLKGNQILIVSYISYLAHEKEINLDSTIQFLEIILKESSLHVDAVRITAGTFDASDEKRAVVLKPIDIVTTASSEGDIYGALNTLPGTQKVGEKGEIFVRGGEGYESKTYMDGMLVQKPYSSSMPDVPSRGRFSPFLFSGTVFSTGGYSAEYGQALSSALILKTNGLPEKDVTGISLMSVGGSISHTKRWNKTSFSISGDYTNLAPYYSLVKQNLKWEKAPNNGGGNIIFRQKVGKRGMIKSFGTYNHSSSRLIYNNYESDSNQLIDLMNDNVYFNTIYNDMINKKWKLETGIAYNYNNDKIGIDLNDVGTSENSIQSKVSFVNFIKEGIKLKFGGEHIYKSYNQDYFESENQQTYNSNFADNNIASFVESEIRITSKFAARIGSRLEYSSLLNKANIAPRILLAQKAGKYGQISVAYGMFYQNAHNDYLKYNKKLTPEKATHYILNYEYTKDERTFRVEAYYKDYLNLVKYEELNLPNSETYNNAGYGNAKGVDILWRDRKTIKNADYMISYSFIDTKRDYKNYKSFATPIFSSKHNLSVVYKHWFDLIDTQFALTFSYSDGRPYYNPNNPVFLGDKTKDYFDLSFNFSYLTKLFGNTAIIHFSMGNILGIDHIYGYRYSNQADENGIYQGHPIKPAAKRFAVLVFMLSLNKNK